ncbi:MAG: phosphotransferase [Verrucomicrobiota bacterium]
MDSFICSAMSAKALGASSKVQSLWSGYGSIVRYKLAGAESKSVIVKHVSPPNMTNHPRGWNTDLSHQRKLRSYQVETKWYQNFSDRCSNHCRVAKCFAVERSGNEVVLILEDLDAVGYPARRTRVSDVELKACLDWLAHFHACFLQVNPDGLWPTGTYWHLETRPDELEVLRGEDPELAAAASELDRLLSTARFQTLVHGDAKLANFCFSSDGAAVAAVDFQYVGGGCGMKDLAYFIGSCLDEEQCGQRESELLDYYFGTLRSVLRPKSHKVDVVAVEQEWRLLYPVAWTDFHRFLKGWSPGHWKINSYSEKLAHEVLSKL